MLKFLNKKETLTDEEKKEYLMLYNEYKNLEKSIDSVYPSSDLTEDNIGLKNDKLTCFDCFYESGGDVNDATMRIIDETPDYQFIETVHSKKGTPLFVLQLKNRVEDKFKVVSRRVEKRGGYYSGHQKGFVFYRELGKKELDEIFKNIFFVEAKEEVVFNEKDDAWKYTISELRNIPYKKDEETGRFIFKYYIDGEPKLYKIKVPSEEYDEALEMFAKHVIGNALLEKKYDKEVESNRMSIERAAEIIKSIGLSLMEVEEDYGDINENIRAAWTIKSSTKKKVYDKINNPYFFERSEMTHLSDRRYTEMVFKAMESGLYQKMVDNDEMSANKAAFIIESAGFQIPEEILNQAILEKGKEVEQLVGGYADGKTIFDISKKHNVPIAEIIKQFKKGVRVEREHTKGRKRIGEIVKDHLYEHPYYYDALKKAEDTMRDISPSEFKTHEEYALAYDEQIKLKADYGDEYVAELKARTLIDKIRVTYKDLQSELPEEVVQFYKNRILNWFVSMFESVVVDYPKFATTWLEYQREYLPKELYGGMFFYGILNKSYIKESFVKVFIENVLSSDLYYGKEPLSNLINIIPDTFSNHIPEVIDYKNHPKDKGLQLLLNNFVKKGRFASVLMGVYFTKKGVFASNLDMDIFIKSKIGYLKHSGIEEGVYGLSENSKDYFPTYGKNKYPMYNMSVGLDFMNKYMGLYSEAKVVNSVLFTNDELMDFYKSLTKLYNAKLYKEFYKTDVVDRNPLNPLSGRIIKRRYPILYIIKSDKLHVFSMVDFIKCLNTVFAMDLDVIEIALSDSDMFISENVERFLSFSENGIRIYSKKDNNIIPFGAVYYNLDKKKFYTNKTQKKESDREDTPTVGINELKIRLSLLKKMFSKTKEEAIEVRLNVVRKMIEKINKTKKIKK